MVAKKQAPKKQVKAGSQPPVIPRWEHMPIANDKGQLTGNAVLSFYILQHIGVKIDKVRSGEWGTLWDALFHLRERTKLTTEQVDQIIHSKYKPPLEASEAYGDLSNILDNLYSQYAEEA